VRVLTFPAASTTLIVPLERAREIVLGPLVTPLPTAPPSVLGLFDLHGEVVPLFDAGALLGLDSPGATPVAYAAVVECHSLLAGLATAGPVAVREVGTDLDPGTVLLDLDTLLAPAR
jgi:chemotaxis signal transduction protein